MPFDPPAIDTDVDVVIDRVLDDMRDRLEGWEPYDGAPEVALGQTVGRESAILGAGVAAAMTWAAAGIGETVHGIAARQGVRATLEVQLEVVAAGGTVPAGFTVVGTTGAGVDVAFEVPDAVVAPDEIFTVTMQAVTPGTVGNGVPTGDLVVVTATSTVVDATAAAPSEGGIDPDTLTEYLDRLVDYLAILRPGGVRGSDLAVLARSVPGVHRAFGLDLYDPDTDDFEAERTATVFPIDTAGAPVSLGIREDVQVALLAAREVNFVIRTAAPTYTPLEVEYSAVAEAGADPELVEANIDAAIAAHLSPATWGTTDLDDQAWIDTPIVRFLDLARVAGSVPGVAFLSALTLNGGVVDVELEGPAPLPAPTTGLDPTTISGTVA